MPVARQLCAGSNRQLMEDADKTVGCPECLKRFTSFSVVANRAQRCPVIPGHLPDPTGRGKVEADRLKKRRSTTPAPW